MLKSFEFGMQEAISFKRPLFLFRKQGSSFQAVSDPWENLETTKSSI